MNAMFAILDVQFKSAHYAVRNESRMKVAALVMLLIDAGLTLWGVTRLRISVEQWHAQRVLAFHLLQLCLFSYLGVAVLTVVGSIQRMLDSDEALILFSLPLASSTRFRTLYSTILISNMWSWMLIEAVVSGYALFPLIGWQTLPWILLLELGAMFSVLCVLIAVLCIFRFVLVGEQWTRRLLFILVVSAIAIGASVGLLISQQHELHIADILLYPGPYIVLFGVMSLLALGPLAKKFGSLYVQAFLVTQGWDRSRRLITLPGIHVLVNMLAKRRTLMGALFTKMLLSQSRNLFAWLRVGMTLLILALFAPLHTLALRSGWSNTLFVAIYAAVLAIVPVLEQAPCAISGEANRLTLYMVAPLDLSQLLRARLMQFLLPSLSIGLIASLFAGWQLYVPLGQLFIAIWAMVLLVTGILTVMVCGSAWDEDIHLAVEGPLQTLLQEEGPITPRRMGLFNLGIAVFVGMVVVLWRMPMGIALPVLMVIEVGLVFVMWRLGCMWLRKVVGA